MQFERPDPVQSVVSAAHSDPEVRSGLDQPLVQEHSDAPTVEKPSVFPLPWDEVRGEIIRVLRGIYDPEIPVNIYDLGLIYGIDRNDEGEVVIRMTLTSPACPVAESLPPMVTMRVAAVPGVVSAGVDLVWDPPWDPSRMTEAARLELGLM